MSKRICFYTSVCEEDTQYVDRYLTECERLEIPFGMNFDRCSKALKRRIRGHRLCVASTERNTDREFTEQDKQLILDVVVTLGYQWTCALDIDETWERDARQKIDEITQEDAEYDYVDTKWVNLWNDPGMIRIDGAFASGHRCKIYRQYPPECKRRWIFDHPITNGPKLFEQLRVCSPLVKRPSKIKRSRGRVILPSDDPVVVWNQILETRLCVRHDLVCLHWGLFDRATRELHKERWDRIYSKAVGSNPYGLWKEALDETNLKVVPHNYF